MSDIQTVYAEWLEKHELFKPKPKTPNRAAWQAKYEELNPKPIWEVDWPVVIAQLISTSGATILSATRVGYSLALVGALGRFGKAVHVPVEEWVLALSESLAAIAAIEVGLIAAGLLWGTSAKKIDNRWFWAMIGIIGLIALASNVSPVAVLYGKEAVNNAAIAVNVIVGIGTPFMVIIGGKILSANYYGGKFAHSENLDAWQKTARNVWNELYAEHKKSLQAWQKKTGNMFKAYEDKRNKATINTAQEKRLVNLLETQPGKIMPIAEAATGLGISKKDILTITSASALASYAGTDVKLTNGTH